jgi:ADP-ribose pyrophosphatase YjhB (NUDIX family)
MLASQVEFCIRCGTKLKMIFKAGRDRPSCPSCGWVFFPDPKVAVVAVIFRDGQVLLTRRANTPGQGRWTFPGGFVDAGEDPARAAERECLEETGFRVRITGLFDLLSGQEHPRGSHILIIYQGDILSGEVRPGDDADRAEFFNLNLLPPLAFRSTQEIIDRISK